MKPIWYTKKCLFKQYLKIGIEFNSDKTQLDDLQKRYSQAEQCLFNELIEHSSLLSYLLCVPCVILPHLYLR